MSGAGGQHTEGMEDGEGGQVGSSYILRLGGVGRRGMATLSPRGEQSEGGKGGQANSDSDL